MYIELTNISGKAGAFNVTSIDSVESGGESEMAKVSNTAIHIGNKTYYVQESYNTVMEQIKALTGTAPKGLLGVI